MRRLTPLLAGVLVLALAACEPSVRWVSPTSGGAAGSPSANPSGSPTWQPCLQEATALLQRLPSGITYECASIRVPQDWAAPNNGQTFDLALPFFVLATQNPIELEGTYPLPEAQLDRFMFNV